MAAPRAAVRAAQRGPWGVAGLSCLFITDVKHVSPAAAAVLATHAGTTLSLRGIAEASPRALALLQATPCVELPGRLRG